MSSTTLLEVVYHIVGIAAPLCTGGYFIARWILGVRDDIKSIKENHLPHIYYMLKLIAEKLQIHEGDGL